MKKYELALVIAPTLDEEALAAEKASVNALIERFGGTVDKVDDWGKRRLAYEINKVNEGFYVCCAMCWCAAVKPAVRCWWCW